MKLSDADFWTRIAAAEFEALTMRSPKERTTERYWRDAQAMYEARIPHAAENGEWASDLRNKADSCRICATRIKTGEKPW